MPALDRRTLLLAGLGLRGAAFARQERPDLDQPGFLRRIVPNPTGRNGCEELLASTLSMLADRLRPAPADLVEWVYAVRLRHRDAADVVARELRHAFGCCDESERLAG